MARGGCSHCDGYCHAGALQVYAKCWRAVSGHARIGLVAKRTETENVDVDLYATTFPKGSFARELAEIIGANNYADPTATLRVWRAALQGIQRQALDGGTNGEFPEFMSDLFRRASEAGCGEQDVTALVKVLRAG